MQIQIILFFGAFCFYTNFYNAKAKIQLPGHLPRKVELSDQEIVDYVNSLNTTWKAAISERFQNVSREERIAMLGFLGISKDPIESIEVSDTKDLDIDIPDTFDGRITWSHCYSLRYIRNQHLCGSCWAFAATEAMSDRTCIKTIGSKQPLLSAEDLVNCCTWCHGGGNNGCEGGQPLDAWNYWISEGIVTGYPSEKWCKNYTHINYSQLNKTLRAVAPKDRIIFICEKKCNNPEHKIVYENDKWFGKRSYRVENSVEAIQKEILKNGPVAAGYIVYEDFDKYYSGVYKHVKGDVMAGHAIRIIGWGTEGGVPYWLCANSWGPGWAGLRGYFKILRGSNECGIESSVTGGLL